jgi:hypothetical protein
MVALMMLEKSVPVQIDRRDYEIKHEVERMHNGKKLLSPE